MKTKRNLFQICLLITAMQYSVSAWAQNLFVSDWGSGTIYQYTPSGVQSTFVHFVNDSGGPPGLVFVGPGYLTFDRAGNLFVAILFGSTPSGIFKYSPNGARSTFATPVSPGLFAAGLAFDRAGNLYATDLLRGHIFEYTNGVNADPQGPNSTRGIFSSVVLTTGQTLTGGMAFDSAGNLFVASDVYSDAASARYIYTINIVAGAGSIYEIHTNGTVSTFATGLTKPEGLAFNKAGDLFASDALDGNIYKFTPDGTRSTFDTGLTRPWGLAFDSMGNLFVADKNSGNIYEYTNGISSERGVFATGLNLPTYLAFQPPPPPPLGISTYNSQPAVFFPTATGTNFVLQMSTNLASGNWVTVSNSIPISGLIITNPPAAAFFRLH